MPKLTLTSNAVAYSVASLAQAINKNFPLSPRDGVLQVPSSAVEAGNAGAIVKFGSPNSNTAPTDVTSPDFVLEEGATIPLRDLMGYPLAELFAKANNNSTILYIQGS